MTTTLGSNSFHIWDLINTNDKQPSLIYVLSRGYTPAFIYDISWTRDDCFISVSTNHGTTHVYFLNPDNVPIASKVPNLQPVLRLKRPLNAQRLDFLSYITHFIYPWVITENGARFDFITVLSNLQLAIDRFEITGNSEEILKVDLIETLNSTLNEKDSPCDELDSLKTCSSNNSQKLQDSWHACVYVESYKCQPFWSLNHVTFSTFEKEIPAFGFQKGLPDLTGFPGTKAFSMIESIALPNGYFLIFLKCRSTMSSSQFPALKWNEEISGSLQNAMSINMDKNEAMILHPRLDQKCRNDVSFEDEWTVQVEGVQMEDMN